MAVPCSNVFPRELAHLPASTRYPPLLRLFSSPISPPPSSSIPSLPPASLAYTTMARAHSESSEDFEFIETPAAASQPPSSDSCGVRTTAVSFQFLSPTYPMSIFQSIGCFTIYTHQFSTYKSSAPFCSASPVLIRTFVVSCHQKCPLTS